MKALYLQHLIDVPEAYIIKGLAEKGVEISMYCNPKSGNTSIFSSAVKKQVSLAVKHKLDIGGILSVRKELKQNEHDIVYAATSKHLSIVNIATTGLSKKPKIVGYRGALSNVNRFDIPSWLSYFHPRVSRIHCVSEAVKDALIAGGINAEKLVTIYKGHDVAWYEKKRAIENIPPNHFIISCVANNRPSKGLPVLLEAMKLLQNESIFLLVIGDMRGGETEAKARELGIEDKVRFLGFQPNASEIVGTTNLYAMPTIKSEGLPKAVIEAMAQAVTPVVTNVGGAPELVRNGVDGLVVPPRDVKALAEAIKKIYDDQSLCQQFGSSAKKRIEKDFSVEQSVSEIYSLYESLLKRDVTDL